MTTGTAIPIFFSFLSTAYVLALIDTLYFAGATTYHFVRWRELIITPLNLLQYNLKVDNLHLHGLHPRYLHVLVNWPLLFGVALWGVGEELLKIGNSGENRIAGDGKAFMNKSAPAGSQAVSFKHEIGLTRLYKQ